MAKKTVDIQKIQVLPGRTLDLDSQKRARKRRKRYTSAVAFWLLMLLPSLIAIVYGRMLGTLTFKKGTFWMVSFCVILTIYGYFGTKRQVYTGRCGLEQPDADGSPYFGSFVNGKGHIRPINLLILFCTMVITSGISLRYLSLYPSENQMGGGIIRATLGSFRSLGFLFSLLLGFSGISAVMVYGVPRFWDRMKAFLRGSLPPFLLLQAAFLLISALVFYLLSRLSAKNADTGAAVQSLGTRILGMAYDTGNPARMLFGGTDSVLASLSSASLYVSLFDTIIERLDEGPEPFREQLNSMLKDRSVRLSSVMMLLSVLFVGLSNFAAFPIILSWILRIAILAAWGYSAYRSFVEIRMGRWFFSTAGVVLVDHLLLLPEVTSVWTGLLLIPAFALRAVGFLTVGVLNAFSIKLAQDTSCLSPSDDEPLDLVHEKTLDEMWKEDNDGKSMAQSIFEVIKESKKESRKS